MTNTTTKLTDAALKALTADEKMDRRFEAWLAASDIVFASQEAERDYKARARRFADAMRLRIPDRVPFSPSFGDFAAGHYGHTDLDLMTDADKVIEVAMKSTVEFQLDAIAGAGGYPASSLEMLDWKLFNWPGHKVPVNGGYQFVEGEYMKADEYDDFLYDPTDYWWRTYLPRIVGALEPLRMLAPPTYYNASTAIPANLSRYGLPEVQAALVRLGEAGKRAMEWQQKTGTVARKLNEIGFPSPQGSSAEAPFDIMGDALRGQRGIIMDMFRQPDKLQEAIDKVTPMMIRMGVSGARLGACPVVMMPLHKGADGFMSDAQFKKFYWPSLLKVILAFNAEGLMPRLFAEGTYNSRLEIIRNDLPKGKTIWHFDSTDMSLAKKVLGDVACIQGNVPVTLIHTGTPETVDAYCKDLIKVAGKGGGYILATGVGIGRNAKVENVRALINAVKKYGVY